MPASAGPKTGSVSRGKTVVGGAELGPPLDQVVDRAVHRPQAQRQLGVRNQGGEIGAGRMRFRDVGLLEDELQIGLDER